MIKAVLFDMDGTVLNTLNDIKDSVNYALSQFGLSPKSDDDIKLAIGNGAYTLIERVVPKTYTEEKIRQVFNVYQPYYEKHSNIHTGPYPGIMDLLKDLKKRGYQIGVVSNKFEHMVQKLNEEIFQGLFDVAIGEVKNIPIKPAPDMIYKALKMLNVTQDEVIYLGDTKTDMQTANNAHIRSVGVTWGFRDENELKEHGAKHIIHHPMSLIELL
jgi:phosphoglycolate phosphatase